MREQVDLALASLNAHVQPTTIRHCSRQNMQQQLHVSNCVAAVQDRFLPIANISRIMKKALPANAKIAKDAKETVQECVSEFISFITSE